MQKRELKFTKGDATGTIDELISWLESAKAEGATHYQMEWSNDPMWAFKWFRTFRIKSDDELKQEKIDKLKNELKELDGYENR